jgi:hypothetical protein
MKFFLLIFGCKQQYRLYAELQILTVECLRKWFPPHRKKMSPLFKVQRPGIFEIKVTPSFAACQPIQPAMQRYIPEHRNRQLRVVQFLFSLIR